MLAEISNYEFILKLKNSFVKQIIYHTPPPPAPPRHHHRRSKFLSTLLGTVRDLEAYLKWSPLCRNLQFSWRDKTNIH